MTPLHLILTVVGAARLVELLMRFVLWLDTPKQRPIQGG